MTPGDAAIIANIPVAADLGRIGTGCDIEIGLVNAVDRQAGQIPRVDVRTEVAGLPAERTCAIITEWGGDG